MTASRPRSPAWCRACSQLKRINEAEGTAMLLRQGEVVEHLTGAQLAAREVSHPYTKELLAATPTLRTTPAGPAETEEVVS
ncbi:hypothetical protein [Microbacterium sp.]|uniref:hypothetical protein n=1 Tax=Microbacterium sp. TaxID=51671 RepID=UPI0037C53D2D